jgi:hypothetical protein
MSYRKDLEKVLDTFLEIQKNLGKTIDIYFKKDGRYVKGRLSEKIGDFYLRWPKIRVTLKDAVVRRDKEEKKYRVIRLILDPVIGDFDYEFLNED